MILSHCRFRRPVLALFLLVGRPCFAQDSLQFSFDLDVPGGRYSSWRLEDVGRAKQLDAVLEIMELRHDSAWAPGFTFFLSAADSGLVVQFGAPTKQPPLRATIHTFVGQKILSQSTLPNVFTPHDTVRLHLDWRDAGVVVVTLGGQRQSVRIPFRPRTIEIAASTGQMIVHRMVLRSPTARL